MTNFCTASNQIGSYASSCTTTQNIITKNIDCVNLDADLVATGNLTVDGVDLSSYPDIVAKTQNIVSTPPGTSFTGPLTAPGLNVTQIAANDPLLGIEIGSVLNQTMASTTGTVMYNMINPSLGTGFNDNMGLEIGTSKTTDNAWQMLYVNNAAALSRRLDFRMRGYTTPTLCLTRGKVGVGNSAPTEALDVTGNVKISGTLTVTGQGPVIHNMSSFASSSGSATKTLTGINAATVSKVKITLQNVGLNANSQFWLAIPGATKIDGEANSGSLRVVSNINIPMTVNNLLNNEGIYGEVTLTKIFTQSSKATWKWLVTGTLYADGGDSGISFNTNYSVSGFFTNATDTLTFTQVQWVATVSTQIFNRSGSTSQYEYEY